VVIVRMEAAVAGSEQEESKVTEIFFPFYPRGRVKWWMPMNSHGSGLSSSVVSGHQMLPMFPGLVASR